MEFPLESHPHPLAEGEFQRELEGEREWYYASSLYGKRQILGDKFFFFAQLLYVGIAKEFKPVITKATHHKQQKFMF